MSRSIYLSDRSESSNFTLASRHTRHDVAGTSAQSSPVITVSLLDQRPPSALDLGGGRESVSRAAVLANDGLDIAAAATITACAPYLAEQTAQPSEPNRLRRARRASISVMARRRAERKRTPSLRLERFEHGSPLNLTESIPQLSLLRGDCELHPPSSRPLTVNYASRDFLGPLRLTSERGLTLSPPTLNWSDAVRELESAFKRACEAVAQASLEDAKQRAEIGAILQQKLTLELREAIGAAHWQEVQAVCRAREGAVFELVNEHVDCAHSQRRAQENDARRFLSSRAVINERAHNAAAVLDEWDRRDHRAMLEATQSCLMAAADTRIARHRSQQARRWEREWAAIAEHTASKVTAERREREARVKAETIRRATEAEQARLKAKAATIKVRVHRIDFFNGAELPDGAALFLAAQCFTPPVPGQPLAYPQPASKLLFSQFIDTTNILTATVESPVSQALDIELTVNVKNIAASTLILSLQACEGRQRDRFIKWLGKRTGALPSLSALVSPKKSLLSPRPQSAAAAPRSAYSARYRHSVITSALELGRLEFPLGPIRDTYPFGEYKDARTFSGVGWNSRAAHVDRRAPPASRAVSLFQRPDFCLESPAALFPPRKPANRSQLEILLMSDKERRKFLENEERKEIHRRRKEKKQRKKFTRHFAKVYFEILVRPNSDNEVEASQVKRVLTLRNEEKEQHSLGLDDEDGFDELEGEAEADDERAAAEFEREFEAELADTASTPAVPTSRAAGHPAAIAKAPALPPVPVRSQIALKGKDFPLL